MKAELSSHLWVVATHQKQRLPRQQCFTAVQQAQGKQSCIEQSWAGFICGPEAGLDGVCHMTFA